MSVQAITGFFRRFLPGTPLCKIPLHDNLSKLCNIAETIEGVDGVTIDKPVGARGFGWKIRLTNGASSGIPAGYAEGTVITQIQYASGYIQIKTAKAIIKDETSSWSNAIEVPTFSD